MSAANSRDKSEHDWLRKYYAGLEGFTVQRTGIGQDGFPYLEMTRPVNGTSSFEKIKVEVSCDQEGNHEGFLFGLPMPE